MNINSKLSFLLIIYIYSYTFCQIKDNFQKGELEHDNSYFIDINDYHSLNLIVTTSQKIYTSDSIPNPISNFNVKVENYSMAATFDQNYLLVACLNDSLLAKINIGTGESSNLLDYNGVNIEVGEVLVRPNQICSLSIFENTVHIAIAQSYTNENILFNKFYIIKLKIANDEISGPIIDTSFETKVFRFPEEYRKSNAVRQMSCEVISDFENVNQNKLLCVYEKYTSATEDNTMVNATTLDSNLTQLDSNEIKISGFSYLSSFFISKYSNTMIKCMTRKTIYNLTLNKNKIKYKGDILIDDAYLNLIYYVKNFGFSSKVATFANNDNRYYIQIYSDSDNYYRIYDRNAISEQSLLKIFSLYNETTDTLYCIYVSEDKIKYFSMTGVANLFKIQSYSKTYKIISNTKGNITLENELIDMTKDYGTIEIVNTLEIIDTNNFNKYYIVNNNNLDNFPYNKSTNILSTIETNNYWYTYSFAFMDDSTDYLRIFHLPNINVTIETCAFQCSSCTSDYSTCVNCRNTDYSRLNGKADDNNCYPINQLFEGYIYDSTTQIFEKCYSSCKFCEEKANDNSSTDHKCKVCAEGYLPSYQYLGNCYKINPEGLNSEKYVAQKSDEYFTLVNSCSEQGKNFKINSTGECVDSCPSSSPYYSDTYTPIDFSQQTNENIKTSQYELKKISVPIYSFNNICYEECPSNTQPNESTKNCESLKAWHHDTALNKIEFYEEDYCLYNEYKYYVSDTKECRNGCPDGYFKFNFECYKDGCPSDTERISSDSYNCISQKDYCYINEHFQNVCSNTEDDEYKYKYEETKQYLKSCDESLIYTTDEVKTYLYNGACYSQCPSQTETDETEKTCTCKYYIYYTDSTKNEYICYEESEICNDKIDLKDIKVCVDSIDDCINKGYKVFNDECYNECPDLTEEDSDNRSYCICKYTFYRDNESNKPICLEDYLCHYKGYLHLNSNYDECTTYEDCFSKNLFLFNTYCIEDGCPEGTVLLTSITNETIKNELIKELSLNNVSWLEKQCVCDISQNWNVVTLNVNIVQACVKNCNEGYEPDDITHKCVEKKEAEAITNQVTTEPMTEVITNPITEVITNPVTEVITNPVTEAITNPVTEAIINPVTEAKNNPTSEVITNPLTEGPHVPEDLNSNSNNIEENVDLLNCLAVYRNRCYPKCPEGTCLTQSDINLKTCVDKEPEMVVIQGICIENLSDIINDSKDNKNAINSVSNLKDTSISGYFINKNVYESSQDSNYTLLYLNECEDLLKNEYKLADDAELFILQIESKNKIKNSAINSYNYGIFLENGTQLNMSKCDGIKITISSPIVDTKSAHLDQALYFSELNYDIYNLSSEFYTDTCAPASLDGNDITLTDRKNDIYPSNISICNDSCDYSSVNLTSKRFICECDSTSNDDKVNEETEEDDTSYLDYFLSLINYKIITCFNLIMDINNFKYNMGLYFGTGTLVICSVQIFIFVTAGVNLMRKKILEGIPTKQKIAKRIKESEEIRKKALEDIEKNNKNIIGQPPKKNNINNKNNGNKKKNQNKKDKDENNDKRGKRTKRLSINKKDEENETQSTIRFKVRSKESYSSLNVEDNTKNKKKSKFVINNFIEKGKGNRRTSVDLNGARRASVNVNRGRKSSIDSKLELGYKNKSRTKRNSLGNFTVLTMDNVYKKEQKIVDHHYGHLILNYNDDDVDQKQLNEIPYSQAMRIDNRNFFKIFGTVIANKIEIINIFYYRDENVHLSLSLSIYIFSLLLDLTLNCFLYTDDVVSEKYHNNGELEFFTSLSLSFMSNIFSGIIVYIIAKLTQYSEFLELIKKDVVDKGHYLMNIIRFKRITKFKMISFFVIQIVFIILMVYYLTIFCIVYHKTQASILVNYLYGVLESLAISFGISLIISTIRVLALKYKSRSFYNASKYIYDKF